MAVMTVPLPRVPPAGLILAVLILALAAAWTVAPGLFTAYSGTDGIPGQHRLAPGAVHWLGTDALGRDILARIIFGARQTLSGAVSAVALGLVAGTALGLAAASGGRALDDAIARLIDVLLAVPPLLLSLTIIILLGSGTINAAIAVGVTSVAAFARLARAEVIRVRQADFVEAAIVAGARRPAVMLRHILPNALPPVLALAAVQFGSAILAISTLGFLGFGAQPPTPEWGLMIAEGRRYLATAWWISIFPGIAVVLIVGAANRISLSLKGEPR
ncbi:MAG: ABC transporter permease [Telmatospirillum sp.]|nr:ABC transporter permease [Telmatospirillum sp.]